MSQLSTVDQFDLFLGLPEAIQRIRRLVLDLAVRGKLVPSHGRDGRLEELLESLSRDHGAARRGKRQSRRVRVPDGFDVDLTWQIPPSWSFVTLETLTGAAGFFTDGDWVESKDQDPDGDVRLTQLADVGIGVWRNRSSRFMRRETAERLNCTYLASGDVLIARMPDPLGRACLFPGDERPCVTAVDVAILRPDEACFDRSFIVQAINAPVFAYNVELKAAGTTRSRVSRGNLSLLPFPVPPFDEQREIAARVDELFGLCDRLEEAQQQATETKRRLMDAVLHQALTAS